MPSESWTCENAVEGGKSPRSFSNEEGEAAERDGDVVVPAPETAALEMIQSEFALEPIDAAEHVYARPSFDRHPLKDGLRPAGLHQQHRHS